MALLGMLAAHVGAFPVQGSDNTLGKQQMVTGSWLQPSLFLAVAAMCGVIPCMDHHPSHAHVYVCVCVSTFQKNNLIFKNLYFTKFQDSI